LRAASPIVSWKHLWIGLQLVGTLWPLPVTRWTITPSFAGAFRAGPSSSIALAPVSTIRADASMTQYLSHRDTGWIRPSQLSSGLPRGENAARKNALRRVLGSGLPRITSASLRPTPMILEAYSARWG